MSINLAQSARRRTYVKTGIGRLADHPLFSAAIVLCLLVVITLIVYLAGGTQSATPHLYYIPILSAAFLSGPTGGIAVALLAGLACGPLMPLDANAGTAQDTVNWLIRGGGFLLIGGLAGLISRQFARHMENFRDFALHSPTTGLPNRAALLDRLTDQIDRRPQAATMLAILKVRLTKTEEIISTLGYDQGEHLMQLLATRLESTAAGKNGIYNINPSRLATIIEAETVEQAQATADALLEDVRRPVILEGIPVAVDAHIGIALYPDHGQTAVELLRAVSQAAEIAVARDLDNFVFEPATSENFRNRLLLLSDLRAAPRTAQLMLHYQPMIDLGSGQCVGTEALLRWSHPTRGMIPPGEFISLAEATGMISPLTLWVARTAIRQLKIWQEAGIGQAISINLSARDLDNPRMVNEIEQLLRDFQVAPSRLILEVTESAVMHSYMTVIPLLERLTGMGCKIAIDDFGTGYSSLACLRHLPAATLKLDRSFCVDIATDTKQRHIVQATIGMAHELELKIVAEGIENEQVLKEMRQLGCDIAQGYHISRPVPEADFRKWLEANGKPPA
ncbi:putative bifunctional diguanylate cyclase/phosphodiesterase [Oceanibaculum indicum]|uniref:putative bifunctional diguanylate cyclase/phosphodiesterase n=1 Tax=Oceanibaculum indicum TaxID=526216 RepID=UPI000A022896|nr:phosphodiesterase [Oceanibaculum indicum]